MTDADPHGDMDDEEEQDLTPDFWAHVEWITERLKSLRQSGARTATSTRTKAFVALVVGFGLVLATLYGSYRLNGLLDTAVYAGVFVLCATIIPISISIFGAGMPGSAALGKGHIALGAFAYNQHYLVQRDDRWDWCPGEADRVYIDGSWHEIDGQENKSVLGWRPFGILRYKTGESLQEWRADAAVSGRRQGMHPDGGEVQIERGGWTQAQKPDISGKGKHWLVDLKRVYASGVRRIGDIELIETAEEIIERGQVDDGTLSGLGPAITFIVALILGCLVGGVVLFLG
jgi:hypothetical protein